MIFHRGRRVRRVDLDRRRIRPVAKAARPPAAERRRAILVASRRAKANVEQPTNRISSERASTRAAVELSFTSESVSEGHPDKVCDRISDEVVDLFFREAEGRLRPGGPRRLRDARHHQPGRDRGRVRAAPAAVTTRPHRPSRPAWPSRTSATSRTASTGRRPRSRCCCTPSRPTSPRASTPPATRTKARATRASCSATPADETPELMPAPIHYAHEILRRPREGAQFRQRRRVARPGRQEPGHRALRERQAGRRRPRSCVSTQHLGRRDR